MICLELLNVPNGNLFYGTNLAAKERGAKKELDYKMMSDFQIPFYDLKRLRDCLVKFRNASAVTTIISWPRFA